MSTNITSTLHSIGNGCNNSINHTNSIISKNQNTNPEILLKAIKDKIIPQLIQKVLLRINRIEELKHSLSASNNTGKKNILNRLSILENNLTADLNSFTKKISDTTDDELLSCFQFERTALLQKISNTISVFTGEITELLP